MYDDKLHYQMAGTICSLVLVITFCDWQIMVFVTTDMNHHCNAMNVDAGLYATADLTTGGWYYQHCYVYA